jgi:hypothetical protein
VPKTPIFKVGPEFKCLAVDILNPVTPPFSLGEKKKVMKIYEEVMKRL